MSPPRAHAPERRQCRCRSHRTACRKDEPTASCFVPARKIAPREKGKQNEEEQCSFCPPLPHAREFEGCPALRKNAQAADFAGLLAWRCCGFAAFPQREQWLANFLKCNHCRVDFKRARHLQVRPYRVAFTRNPYPVARTRAASALQSRGGDGFFIVGRVKQATTNRLPEHEVCGECGLRNSAAGLGWTRKLPSNYGCQTAGARPSFL